MISRKYNTVNIWHISLAKTSPGVRQPSSTFYTGQISVEPPQKKISVNPLLSKPSALPHEHYNVFLDSVEEWNVPVKNELLSSLLQNYCPKSFST